MWAVEWRVWQQRKDYGSETPLPKQPVPMGAGAGDGEGGGGWFGGEGGRRKELRRGLGTRKAWADRGGPMGHAQFCSWSFTTRMPNWSAAAAQLQSASRVSMRSVELRPARSKVLDHDLDGIVAVASNRRQLRGSQSALARLSGLASYKPIT